MKSLDQPIRAILACTSFLILCPHAWSASPDFCTQYAQRAVQQYQLMSSHAQCHVPNDLRWQANVNNHFNGCRLATESLMRSEQENRDNYLRACGGLTNANSTAQPTPPGVGGTVSASIAQAPSNPSGPALPATPGGPPSSTPLTLAPSNVPAPALPPAPLDSIPIGLLECEGNQCDHGNSSAWVFHGQKGVARWPSGAIATLDIERFNSGSVVIHRIDAVNSSSPGFTAIYQGTLQNGRVDGTVTATWPGHFPNAKPPGVVQYTWFATIPETNCDHRTPVTAQEALDIGQTAFKFQQITSAFKCFSIAARQGDAQARGLVGLMYRDAIGTTVDYPEAFHWLKAGAIQGDYNSQVGLEQMYELGLGTTPDPKMAQVWKEKAQNNPVILQQRAQAQQQQAAQQMLFIGLAAILFGGDSDSSSSDKSKRKCWNRYTSLYGAPQQVCDR